MKEMRSQTIQLIPKHPPPIRGFPAVLAAVAALIFVSPGAAWAGSEDRFLECTGTVIPQRRLEVVLAPGQLLQEVYVRRGQRVEAGTPLAELLSLDMVQRAASLTEAELAAAHAEAEDELRRLQIEQKRRFVTRLAERIAAERRVREEVPDYLVEGKLRDWLEQKRRTEEEIAVLEQQVAAHAANGPTRRQLAELRRRQRAAVEEALAADRITAPFAGRVARVSEAGVRAEPGATVVELWDDQVLRVEADLWQHQVAMIFEGQSAHVSLDLFGDRWLPATVLELIPARLDRIGDDYPTFQVVVGLDDRLEDLVVGMKVSVRIEIEP
jgi:multidrug efflux pump subunit AcrA (membrane-fusion protein)